MSVLILVSMDESPSSQWWTWANSLIPTARLCLVLDALSCQYPVPWSHAVEEKFKSYSHTARIFSLCDLSACTVQCQRAASWALLGIPVGASTVTYGSNVTLGNPWNLQLLVQLWQQERQTKELKPVLNFTCISNIITSEKTVILQNDCFQNQNCWSRVESFMRASYLCPFPVTRVFTAVNCAWSKSKSPGMDLVGKLYHLELRHHWRNHLTFKVAVNHTNVVVGTEQ